MNNMHTLAPCATCEKRMAVPGKPCCTTCVVELLMWEGELA